MKFPTQNTKYLEIQALTNEAKRFFEWAESRKGAQKLTDDQNKLSREFAAAMAEHLKDGCSRHRLTRSIDEQGAGNPRHCWRGRGGVLRRNREWAGTENESGPETGQFEAAASFAA